MNLVHGFLILAAAAAPGPRDRVYTADQTSNTVSVFDPKSGSMLGLLRLGAPRSDVLSPLYRGQANVHGLGFSPDHKTLAVVSIATNAVTFVDTATNAVKGTTYVGRAPHEAFYTPDGKEIWVSVRGEDHVSVIDAATMRESGRIGVPDGPGMVRFRADGAVGFVVSSFTPEAVAVDVKSHQVVARIPVTSPFSPNLDVCSDDQMWMTHKDVGKVTVIDARSFKVRTVLDTGPITNHVACVDNSAGKFAFVTVGGLDVAKVFTREEQPKLVATIPTGALPHGVWPSDDGTRVFVGLENGDGVAVVDAVARKELKRIPGGQAPQALVYVSNAAPEGNRSNLEALDQSRRPIVIVLRAASGGAAAGSVAVRQLGVTDALDLLARGLPPDAKFTLAVGEGEAPPFRNVLPIATFRTNAKGAGQAQALGPIREIVSPDGAPAPGPRTLLVTGAGGAPVLLGKVAP